MFIGLRERGREIGDGGREGRERERERERNIDWLPPPCAPAGDLTHSPGMCPD